MPLGFFLRSSRCCHLRAMCEGASNRKLSPSTIDNNAASYSRIVVRLARQQRRLAALGGVPEAKLDPKPIGIEILQPVERVTLVIAVLADGVKDDAVGGAAQTDGFAVVEIDRRFGQQLGLDQFVKRFRPTVVPEAEALGGEGGDGAVKQGASALFRLCTFCECWDQH